MSRWSEPFWSNVLSDGAGLLRPARREIEGTSKDDFIHTKDDGLVPPPGYNDISKLSNGLNFVDPGAGTDIVHGGAGDMVIEVDQPSDISGLAEILDGGRGRDQLVIEDGAGLLDLTTVQLISIEQFDVSAFRGELDVLFDPSQLSGLEINAVPGQGSSIVLAFASPGSLDWGGLAVGQYTVFGSGGADSISITGNVDSGGLSAKTIDGGAGDDVITFDPTSRKASSSVVLDGGDGDDRIVDGAEHAALHGGGGDDALTALHRFHTLLDGGVGADVLTGGGGSDTLAGGVGADRFVLARAGDSAPERPDLVTDFSHADGDRIDLSAIDGDSKTVGVQGFHLIAGGAFTGHADELIQFVDDHGRTVLEGDTNSNGRPDFALLLKGAPVLVQTDILDATSAQPAHPHASTALAAHALEPLAHHLAIV